MRFNVPAHKAFYLIVLQIIAITAFFAHDRLGFECGRYFQLTAEALDVLCFRSFDFFLGRGVQYLLNVNGIMATVTEDGKGIGKNLFLMLAVGASKRNLFFY